MIEAKAAALLEVLREVPFVVSVGAGEGELIVYVERKKLGAMKAIPSRFEGLPVRVAILSAGFGREVLSE